MEHVHCVIGVAGKGLTTGRAGLPVNGFPTCCSLAACSFDALVREEPGTVLFHQDVSRACSLLNEESLAVFCLHKTVSQVMIGCLALPANCFMAKGTCVGAK